MSREIRRVPEGWQHPTYRTMRFRRGITREIETWKPLLDDDFAKIVADYDADKAAWEAGERPEGSEKYSCASYEEWAGERPEPDYYVPYDVNGERPWFQMYETVSEGTPVTPAFATADQLIDFLATNGEQYEDGETSGPWDRDRAEQFVRNERWFPSGVIANGQMFQAKDGWPS